MSKKIEYMMVIVDRNGGGTLWSCDSFFADEKYSDSDFLQRDYAKRCYLAEVYRCKSAINRLSGKSWHIDCVAI